MMLLRMAWRNVWRNTRRSVVTMASMAFALWVMVLYSGLVQGYLGAMEDDILEMEVGDLQIHAEGYLAHPNVYDVIDDPDAIVSALHAQGYGAAPRLLAGGLGASGEASAGIMLRGIVPELDATVLKVADRVDQGTWLDASDPKGVVLGRRLARSLGAGPGSELVVLTQGTDGSMANDLFTVRGVLDTISDGTDRAAVFLLAPAFRDLLVLDSGAHEIIVHRPRDVALPDAEATVTALAPGDDVKSWREIMPTLASMLDATASLMVIIFLIVYLAIGILVLNAVLMAVFERVREFGVMKAIGVGPLSVFTLIVLETTIQTVLAIAVGLLLALPVGWYLATVGIDVGVLGGTSVMGVSMHDIWLGQFTPQLVGTAIVVLVVIVCGATIWPAFKAARLRPVDAMRYR
ncbi:MAG: ABC transporter permease [Alphaproteobacteria bacterium]|nr:ABC transporter permease [Alphaproteobacteria bacterium]